MRLIPLLALLLAVLSGCGDSTPPDNGGAWTATLTAPAGTVDGAAVIELNDADIEAVSSLDGTLFSAQHNGTTRVVIVRDEPGGIRFRIQLRRGSDLPRATVIEVAAGDDTLRPSVAQYSVRFAR